MTVRKTPTWNAHKLHMNRKPTPTWNIAGVHMTRKPTPTRNAGRQHCATEDTLPPEGARQLVGGRCHPSASRTERAPFLRKTNKYDETLDTTSEPEQRRQATEQQCCFPQGEYGSLYPAENFFPRGGSDSQAACSEAYMRTNILRCGQTVIHSCGRSPKTTTPPNSYMQMGRKSPKRRKSQLRSTRKS